MDIAWWLVITGAAIYPLCQAIRRLPAASRRIDDDIAAFNREHPPPPRPISTPLRTSARRA